MERIFGDKTQVGRKLSHSTTRGAFHTGIKTETARRAVIDAISDLAALERKIQISLKPAEHSTSDEAQGESTTVTPDTNVHTHSIESPQTNGQSNAVGESVSQATTHSLTDSRLSV
ncbi:MAG: hypothetical protein RRX93_07520 [Bacteroidales bacterium]